MRKLLIAALLLLLLAALGFALTPPALIGDVEPPAMPEDLDRYLAEREQAAAAAYPLVPGTRKRIRWHDGVEKTEYAIVNLHGFSGSRQGIAPLVDRLADTLGANLFETRLAGHGRTRGAMQGVKAEDWLADGLEALAIGAELGQRIVVIGTSTGATLAIALADSPAFESVDTLVLISPNFAPADPLAGWITRPGGPFLLQLAVGETRSWQPHNEQQGKYWSTSYPSAIVVEVMRLVDRAHGLLPLNLQASVLTLLSPDDQVVSPQATERAMQRIDAPRKQIVEMTDVGDPSQHVLAGDILSPDSTDEVLARIVEFIRAGRSGK